MVLKHQSMDHLPEDLQELWDVIVIGTGIGGATLGHAMAAHGERVLFCERGRSSLGDGVKKQGDYAEMFFPHIAVPSGEHRAILAASGRWADMLEDASAPRVRRHIPFIGSGTGGSSALYGAAMERFFSEDFRPGACFPDRDRGNLPDAWPIQYSQLAPYYQRAERLYSVKGGLDPLRTDTASSGIESAPAFTPANQALSEFLDSRGLHPYRLPSACEFVPGCQTCQGFLCPNECKNDSGRVCLQPALRESGARLIDQCRVLRLNADKDRVNSVLCRYQGQDIELRGRTIILAAGALATPVLLLRSSSNHWPKGLANDSGLVGRNLMRHCIDLYALDPRVEPGAGDNLKEIALNDFYYRKGEKLGTVQSFGRLPPASMLAASVQHDMGELAGPLAAGFFGLMKPLMRPVLRRLFDKALILATTMEDLPYQDNRVQPVGADGIGIRYRLNGRAHRRIRQFRRRMENGLKPWPYRLLKQAENNDRIAHACGTCRMGRVSTESVVDRHNRAHGLENLYIVDSSFFPSSGGTNPSLTIAANALRVADHLTGNDA